MQHVNYAKGPVTLISEISIILLKFLCIPSLYPILPLQNLFTIVTGYGYK